jgi:uncharacterized protein (DUF58 family)
MARRRTTLTTRGVVALGIAPLSAVAGLLTGAEELVLLSIALLTLVATGLAQSAHRAALARGHWHVTAALSSSDVEVGSRATLRVTLAAAAAAVPLWLEDPQHCWTRISRSFRGEPERRALPGPSSAVPVPHPEGGGGTRIEFPVPTGARGIYAVAGLRLWCFDSFALVAQLVAIGPSATITVYPVPTAVELAEELLRGVESTEDSQPASVVSPTKGASLGDFSGIRSYVPGDRLRLLYWPALARTGDLMVRDFEDSGPNRVHVVADLRATNGPAGCESVLSMAAGVGVAVLARGSVVELSATSGERIAVGPGPFAERALLRAIAGMETTPPPAPRSRWRRRRRDATTAPRHPETVPLHVTSGRSLMITTARGAADMSGLPGSAHLVIAP